MTRTKTSQLKLRVEISNSIVVSQFFVFFFLLTKTITEKTVAHLTGMDRPDSDIRIHIQVLSFIRSRLVLCRITHLSLSAALEDDVWWLVWFVSGSLNVC